ncbi:MAG: Rrf2 family transcriptional regulator [Chloroflexi bacterium]|nr:Rrf2 family transcriptional regulator [Chloroflexota bacterium]
MKISARSDYGVRALTDLALHYGKGPIPSNEIATRQAIPEPYLDQLMTVLRKAGLIRSIRGPAGGHVLAKPPAEIALSEVINILEGSMAPIACAEETTDCPHINTCVQREVWLKVKEGTQQVLSNITIADIAAKQSQRTERQMYYI